MYYSPVPLLVIRADTPALVEVNGHPAGECGADAHIALPLSDSGDYYVALLPLGRLRGRPPLPGHAQDQL